MAANTSTSPVYSKMGRNCCAKHLVPAMSIWESWGTQRCSWKLKLWYTST